MNTHGLKHLFTGLVCSTAILGCQTVTSTTHTQDTHDLVVATWNVEHLAAQNNQGCKGRENADYAALTAYKNEVDADIYALQEVGSVAAVHRVFNSSEWQVFISDRADSPNYTCRGSGKTSTQQKVAYAVKKSILVKNVNNLDALSAPLFGLRHALQLNIEHAGKPLSFINFHLKSGCFVSNYLESDRKSCGILAQQAKILKSTLKKQQKSQPNLVLLGDFNHHLANENNRLRADLGLDTTEDKSAWVNTTDSVQGCHPKYPAPIDHIIVSSSLVKYLEKPKSQFHYFDDMTPNKMPSDHCALTISFNF
jgi:endonuclease/exonuclease/phosphatase family metal-dependent hydrolase